MAAAGNNERDRRIIHCLMCSKPQEVLSAHLTRVCMKNSSDAERKAELLRAKKSMKVWTRHGRNWDYAEMCRRYPDNLSRYALLEDLRRGGFFIANAPMDADIEPSVEQPSTSAAAEQAPIPASGITEEEERSSEETTASGSNDDVAASDPTWQKDTAQYTTSLRVNMQRAGLYEKFPREAKHLTGFKHYLTDTLAVPNCQQEIDNVSRMLRYIQPSGNEVNLDFLVKSTETQDFLNRLKGVKMGPSTIMNYVKNMMRFVQYLRTLLDLAAADQDFHRKCQAYIELLNTLRKPVAKALSKDTCKKRYERFIGGQPTIHDCQRVLRESKKDMLDIYGKLLEKQYVEEEKKTLFRYYCEAILILRHFQRPGAVEGMTVSEWVNKKVVGGRVCVAVSNHKTATMQIATFALTQEESAMLDAYYHEIRPECIKEGVDDQDRFFLVKRGTPICSSSNDVSRLHGHYKLPKITSQEVRRVGETEANAHFSEEQKSAAAHYMAHSTAVANAHYRMRTMESIVATANLFSSLSRSSDESGDERSGRGQKRGRDAAKQDGMDFAAFVQLFPVKVNGQPPTKKQRIDAGFGLDRVFYDRWRAAQFGKREEHLLSQYSRHPPTVQRVEKAIRDEGWTANHPRPEDIAAMWKPANRVQVESDPHIMKRVTSQKWKGLATRDFGGNKGKGVVATKPFAKGSIICDYHGRVITAAEGRKMMDSLQDRMYYLFFFTAGGRALCIDAQTFPCECHPSLQTTGRLINHSGKNFNVKPLYCKMNFEEGARDVILFQASRDISMDEEIRFHYGVKRKSFQGEGLDLEWLDD